MHKHRSGVFCLASILLMTGCVGCSNASTPSAVVCAGTGVTDRNAKVSVDFGTHRLSYAVSLKVGDVIFLGANDCNMYQAPPATSVAPELEPSSLDTTMGNLGFEYRAVAPGTTAVKVRCVGVIPAGCAAPVVTVEVTVSSED